MDSQLCTRYMFPKGKVRVLNALYNIIPTFLPVSLPSAHLSSSAPNVPAPPATSYFYINFAFLTPPCLCRSSFTWLPNAPPQPPPPFLSLKELISLQACLRAVVSSSKLGLFSTIFALALSTVFYIPCSCLTHFCVYISYVHKWQRMLMYLLWKFCLSWFWLAFYHTKTSWCSSNILERQPLNIRKKK